MEKEEGICEEECPYFNLINKVKLSNIDRENIQELSEIFKWSK